MTWSGASFGNSAAATGQITMDMGQVDNPGFTTGPAWLHEFTITVTGAATGNGTWSKADFYDFRLETGPSALDFTNEWVGQDGWGDYYGQFEWGYSMNGAPEGFNRFTIRTDSGSGEELKLTSIKPAPLSHSLVLQPDFNQAHGHGVNQEVHALAEDSQGRLIAGGLFYSAGLSSSPGIARFLKGGQVDPQFIVGSGISGGSPSYIADLVVLPDDSLVAVGDFRYYNGTFRGGIVKILPSGTIDETFAIGGGAQGIIHCVKRLPDGKFLIGGEFHRYDGVLCKNLVRLNENGALDATFDTGSGFEASDDYVKTIQVLDGGATLVAGRFSVYQGHFTRNIMRIHPDGDVDATFASTQTDVEFFETMTVLSSGKILVGGTNTGQKLFRLNPDGGLDAGFVPDFEGSGVRGVLELPPGNILVSGEIQNTSGNGFSNLLVLEPDGALKADGFNDPVLPNEEVGPLLQAADESIYVGGAFFAINGTDYGRLARFFDSSKPIPDVFFLSNKMTVEEGTYGSLVEVGVGNTLTNGVEVNITVEADDPAILSQVSVQPSVYVDPNSAWNFIYVDVQDDSAINGPRSFRLRMTPGNSGAVVVGLPDVMTITVMDDDVPGTVFLESASGVMNEGHGALPVKVKRYLDDPGSHSVRLRTVDGTALAGRDYQALDTTVSFPEGVYEQTVMIEGPVSSPELNPIRNFTVELYDPAAGALVETPGTATIAVNDKDDPGSSVVAYSVPDPARLVRIVDLALDADGVLYGIALYSLGSPSAMESQILKFSSDGTGETIAVVPTGSIYSWLSDIAIGSDGKIYVGGPVLLRYSRDGTLDNTWTSPGAVSGILPLPDGKVMIVTGVITDPVSGHSRKHVARLLPNGSLDPAFQAGSILYGASDGLISAVARDSSGGILIAGSFDSIQGSSRRNVARLFSDGTLDTTFNATSAVTLPGLWNRVSRIHVTPEGKILLASSDRLIRVHSNGSSDPGFPTIVISSTFYPIRGFFVQPDGKVALSESSIRRISASGEADTEFSPFSPPDGQIYNQLIGPDGHIHLCGEFSSIDGQAAPCIATLLGGLGSAGGVIEWDSSGSAVGEAIGNPEIRLRRLDSTSGSVGVHYTLVPETASTGSDVEAFFGYHMFAPGESEYLVETNILNDAIQEATESFRLVLHDSSGGALVGSRTEHAVDIIDDDGSGIDSWIARFFPLNPLDESVLGTDSDGDGVDTFAEWMTDSDPTLASDVKRPQSEWYIVGPAGAEAKHFGVSFYHDPSKAGFRTIVEKTGSMADGSWSAIWDSIVDPQMESDLIQEHPVEGAGWMSVRSPDVIGTREFLRIRYERSP